ALALAFRDAGIDLPRTSALTRRRMMQLSAAAAGAAAVTSVLDWSAYAKQERPKGPVGIVGGGVAGLTAAYRLQQHGAKPVLFEASNRWSGRMFTMYDFYKGMFVELGGEFVDSNHEDLHTLAKEVSVEMQDLTTEGGEELYFFKGQFHTPKDMVAPEKKSGAFAPIAKQIAKDAAKLTDKHDIGPSTRPSSTIRASRPIWTSSAAKPTTGRSICSMWHTTSNSGCLRKIN